jgi:hypothetical protein
MRDSHHSTPRTDRTREAGPARSRWSRVVLTAATATVLAASAAVGATASTASAATLNGVATIASPGTTTPLTQGGSADTFTVSLPAQAACSGDTATGGYHVYSYLVPAGTNLSTVTFNGHPSSGYGLYESTGKYYGAINTAVTTGQIIGIPNDFAWAPLVTHAGVSLSTLLYTGSGSSASGVWETGLACATSAGVVSDNWNTQITFSHSSSDPNGFTWSTASATAPTVTSAASTTFSEGSAGSFQVTATGSPAPSFAETGVLPAGVTLSPTGLLSGTPTQSGSFPISITASNSAGTSPAQSFTLTVSVPPFGITTASTLPTATPGQPYSGVTFATGGAGPGATFKWKGSGFPKALKVAKSGALAGTPSTKLVPGTVYHPTVSVTETVITHNGKKKVKTKTVATKVFTLTVG